MGFDIREEVTTTLHYKDIALIAVAIGEYKRVHGRYVDPEVVERADRLVERLGSEMMNV
jgi:hypothetical protein